MRLLGVGAFILCLGALLLFGSLAIASELFCECMLAAPSGSFSAISTDS
jgi:hypothetical protein